MKYRALQIICIVFLFSYCICTCFGQPNFIYEGGGGDTYASYTYEEGAKHLYEGGDSDGYAAFTSNELSTHLFEGGDGDGFASGDLLATNTFLYEGGDDDGYAYVLHRTPFIWTGAVGTSWTVPGNWNYDLIPGIHRPVIIPYGVPNWPYVNAGLLAIADTPNGSNFRCASLWIQENAFLQTRINCRVENYGLIQIDGEMRVKKLTVDAFQNFSGGQVNISSTGLLNIKP